MLIKFESLVELIGYMKTNSGIWMSEDDPRNQIIGFEKGNVRLEINYLVAKEECRFQNFTDSQRKMFLTTEGRIKFGKMCYKY